MQVIEVKRMSEKQQKELMQSFLNCLKERIQNVLSNRLLEIDWCDGRQCECSWTPGDGSYFFIAEVHYTESKSFWSGFTGIFGGRKKSRDMLFNIDDRCFFENDSDREVLCEVFNPLIVNIVKEEVQKYADAIKATRVRIVEQFI